MKGARDRWEQELHGELPYWDEWLEGKVADPAERAFRLSSNRPFPLWAKPLVPALRTSLRVLDVGAGPVTALGNRWEGRDITIVPVDPLAQEYAALLHKYRITPHTATIAGMGEELEQLFGRESFDLAYACNSLDRAWNPIQCYRQMLAVLRPGCSLVTVHESNSAERTNYDGPCRWNFSVRESRLEVWNRGNDFDLLNQCSEAGHYRIETEGTYIRFTVTKKPRA